MPPIYDGSECTYCEVDAGAEHGFDEETPCDECGWYRRRSDGFRYPSTLPEVKAFTASTWQLALNKVEQIQEDFPELSKGSIVGAVEVVGVDDDGGHVYSIDSAGGSIPDVYCATGSGSPYMYGVLEDGFKEGMSRTDALKLAARALHASGQRDAASGNGMDLAVITAKDGYVALTQSEISKLLS